MSDIKAIEPFGEFRFDVVLKSGTIICTGWKEMFERVGRQSIRKATTGNSGTVLMCDDALIKAEDISAIIGIVFEEEKEEGE